MEQKTAQLRAKPKVISQYGSSVFFETPSRAQFLISTGQFELVNAGPSAGKPTGPSERKPAGPSEKKLSDAGQDGLSTDSVKSNEHGVDVPASASQPGQVSPLSNADLSQKRGPGRPKKSE